MAKYSDYVEDETTAGREPLSMEEWRVTQMQKARAEKAQIITGEPPQPDPEDAALDETASHEAEALRAELDAIKAQLAALAPAEEVEVVQVPKQWGEDGVYTYFSHFKEHVLIVRSERGIGPDGRLVTSAHKTIEFSDNLYSTSDESERDFIESHAQFGKEIFRTTQMTSKAVAVTDGPRVGIQPRSESRSERPSPLHAHV